MKKKSHISHKTENLDTFLPAGPPPQRYSFDTSAFINTWRRYQPIDVFPRVWEDLAGVISEQRILCSVLVRMELKRQDDDLLKWVLKYATFLDPTEAEESIVEEIINNPAFWKWASGQKNQADPFVVALGRVYNCPVVTWEHTSDNKLGNTLASACRLQGVEAISFIEFQRREQFRYT